MGLRFDKQEIDKWIRESSRRLPAWAADPRGIYELRQILNTPAVSAITLGGGAAGMPKGEVKSGPINLGYGAIYTRKTRRGLSRYYLDYRDENGKRIQKIARAAISQGTQPGNFGKRSLMFSSGKPGAVSRGSASKNLLRLISKAIDDKT